MLFTKLCVPYLANIQSSKPVIDVVMIASSKSIICYKCAPSRAATNVPKK
jgi:hypothetical protein